MAMLVRIHPKTLTEALQGLNGSFEAASTAASALGNQSQRLASDLEQLARTRQEGARALLEGLEAAGQVAALATTAVSKEQEEMGDRLARVNRLKDESQAGLANQGLGMLAAVEASSANVDRHLAVVSQRLDEVERLAERGRQELLQHLQGTVEFFSLLDRGERELHRELSKLKNHFAEQAEFRNQREVSKNQLKAQRATEAGICALQAGGLDEAEARFREAYALCPAPAALFNLALVLILANKPQESERLLSAASLGQCDPVEVQALKSLKALRAGDYSRALKEAEAGLHIRPDHLVLRKLAATAALAVNSAATAVRYLSPPEIATLRTGFAELSRQ